MTDNELLTIAQRAREERETAICDTFTAVHRQHPQARMGMLLEHIGKEYDVSPATVRRIIVRRGVHTPRTCNRKH